MSMKKNLLTVLILALMIVNIALSVITMISVTGTNKKTAALVDTIATVLNLEIVTEEDTEAPKVKLEDMVIYAIDESMTIPLEPGDDGKQVYMVCKVAVYLDTTSDDYKKYNADTIGTYEPLIKETIEGIISSYDQAYCTANRDSVKKEVLKAIQSRIGSEVICDISISDVKFG